MKLSLDQLKVDSYATQVSNQELTEVKGGTSPGCIVYGVVAVVGIAAGALWGASTSSEASASVSGICEHGYEISANCGSQSTQDAQ